MTLFALARPVIFAFDPETAHHLSLTALRFLPPSLTDRVEPLLQSRVAGIDFPNPVGLAPGYDKNAQVPRQMLRLGFGFVEVGTLTPLPQEGNPRPRLFRLTEDRAVINRMGFNNEGQEAAHKRLTFAKSLGGVVGVNIGANKDSVDRIADYAAGVARMKDVASYITVNISSPNTPGLRMLQDGDALDDLLSAVREVLVKGDPPVFLKVAPDLSVEEIDAITKVAVGRVDALIVSNTTVSRPELLSSQAEEKGGLSGAPLRDLAHHRLIDFRKATGGETPLIGVGGIATAEDAYARIRAGASLVQLYSALVYEGPGLAARITKGLTQLLARDGFANVADAVGIDAR
jgi:dihydroorotate dehydrogenase